MIPVESLNRFVSQPQFEAFSTGSCSFQLGMDMAIHMYSHGYTLVFILTCVPPFERQKEV